MATPVFAVLVAKNKNSLLSVAKARGWKVLPNTGYDFNRLTSDNDHSIQFDDGMDSVVVNGPGCVALAYRIE